MRNEAFNVNVPLFDTSFAKIFSLGKVLTEKLFVFFVEVEPFDRRGVKSLTFKGTETIDAFDETKTYELYVIQDELTVNPVVENILDLRAQSSVCQITLEKWEGAIATQSKIDYVHKVVSSVDAATCEIIVCPVSACAETLSGPAGEEFVIGYEDCPCDVVLGIDDDDYFFAYTVAFQGSDQTGASNITLFGFFDEINTGEELGAKSEYGIPINSPVYPSIVPRFTTLQQLADAMGEAITDFTGINTTIAVSYSSGTQSAPGSFIFGIEFSKSFDTSLEFQSSLSLGDLADLSVEDASLNVTGSFSISNEFAVVFQPNESDRLKLLGSLSDNCAVPDFASPLIFDILWRLTDGSTGDTTVTIADCDDTPDSDDRDGRVQDIIDAFGANNDLSNEVSIRLVGDSTVVIDFDPRFAYVEMVIANGDEDNPFGFSNDTMVKSGFQFANGLTQVCKLSLCCVLYTGFCSFQQ